MKIFTRLSLPHEEVIIDRPPLEVMRKFGQAMEPNEEPLKTKDGVQLPLGWCEITDIEGNTLWVNAIQAAHVVRPMSEEKLEVYRASQAAGVPMEAH